MKALFPSCLVSNRSAWASLTKLTVPTLMTLAVLLMSATGMGPDHLCWTAVGTATPATQTVTVSLQAAGTVAKLEVLTLGAPNLDFTESGTDNCAGISPGAARSQ